MKIAIIKLGAKGDVARTLPIAKAIREKHNPEELHWFTTKSSAEILEGISFIDHIHMHDERTNIEFDHLFNFDIDKSAARLAMNLRAKKKYGFGMEEDYISPFNISSEYYLNTLFDDEIKKNNKKTYQEMMCEIAEIDSTKENIALSISEKEKQKAKEFAKINGINPSKLIGIHMGASQRWPSKVWHEVNLKSFIFQSIKKGYQIILFGGPNEIERHKRFTDELEKEGINVFRNNPNNTFKEFTALVDLCRIMICSDSFALHVSLALNKPTVGLFFCTSPNEVEDYGLLKKIVSEKLTEFFPERMNEENEELTKSISAEQVLEVVEELARDTNK